jgi:hypothetical protein
MLFLHAESMNARSAELQRAADRSRRDRGRRAAHPAATRGRSRRARRTLRSTAAAGGPRAAR